MAKATFLNKVIEAPTLSIGNLMMYKSIIESDRFVVLVTSISQSTFSGVVVEGGLTKSLGYYEEAWSNDRFIPCSLGSQVIITQ